MPAPLGPTMAMVSPAAICRSTAGRAPAAGRGSRSSPPRNSISPLTGGSAAPTSPAARAARPSRAAAATSAPRTPCVWPYTSASPATGRVSSCAYSRKLTSSAGASLPPAPVAAREPQHQHDAGRGDELGRGPSAASMRSCLRREPEDAVDLLAVARRLLRLAREGLDRRQHAEVLLGDGDRGGFLVCSCAASGRIRRPAILAAGRTAGSGPRRAAPDRPGCGT